MALIVITVTDGPDNDVNVSVQAEPGFDTGNPEAQLSGAQVAALNMLQALKTEPVKQDRGLIQLIN